MFTLYIFIFDFLKGYLHWQRYQHVMHAFLFSSHFSEYGDLLLSHAPSLSFQPRSLPRLFLMHEVTSDGRFVVVFDSGEHLPLAHDHAL